MQYRNIIPLVLLSLWLAACGALPELPAAQIARHPAPEDFTSYNVHASMPKYDPNSTDPFQVDLRSSDLTKLDLSKSTEDLLYADFDSKTKWPSSDKMPAGFDRQKIMEMAKNPGLRMQALHRQGITGKGIGIAIVDQTLLVDHVEYKDQLRVYEEAEDVAGSGDPAQMHGPAVASIAVGKTVGVAPEADLYFIAMSNCGGATSVQDLDFSCRAHAIQRIVEINKALPEGRKIRVLSLSWSWHPQNIGYDKITAAVNEARTAGIFVISTNIQETYGLHFHGLGRDPLASPDELIAYQPGLWWSKDFFAGKMPAQSLLVPMDARTTASPTGVDDYAYYRTGGWSWCIPYLAGTYALAAQVKPDITPELFWKMALETGQTIQVQHDGKSYPFGTILDPQALIAALQK